MQELAVCSAVAQPGGNPVTIAATEWFQRFLATRQFLVGKPFVSINIATRQIRYPNFIKSLKARLRAHPRMRAEQFELEILETAALGDIKLVGEVMRKCLALGVGFAMDDFGTVTPRWST
jgi:EAL domain-containing protein (putative c-di-GMP-specific phosphodiesterase class I)